MANRINGTLALLNVKINTDDKDAFFAECEARGVSPSLVIRKLIEHWMSYEMDLKI